MKKNKFVFSYSLILLFVLSGCSTNLKNSTESTDPFESLNRNIFAFNKSLDQNIVSPLSAAYVETIPYSIRKNISKKSKI